jgi:hypothetical protein
VSEKLAGSSCRHKNAERNFLQGIKKSAKDINLKRKNKLSYSTYQNAITVACEIYSNDVIAM